MPLKYALMNALLRNATGEAFCRRRNWLERFKKKPAFQFEYKHEDQCYLLHDGQRTIHFARPNRSPYFADGITTRLNRLWHTYVGPHYQLPPNAVVVDCGANIGEFALAAHDRGAEVFAFEPDPVEFAALRMNASERIKPLNFALWNTEAILQFHSANQTGDSGVFPSGRQAETMRVNAVRLDECITPWLRNRRIALLKLEAEGAEPEVLEGAAKLLDRIDAIAADLGPERGAERATTVVPVAQLLIANGFEISHFDAVRCTFLFTRTPSAAV
jgi:FkbM family methyltransferase